MILDLRKCLELVRKSIRLYVLARRFAPLFCKFLLLEEGFVVLKRVNGICGNDLCVIDVGSNDGTSINMIRQFLPEIDIYAFDPVISVKEGYKVFFKSCALGEFDSQLIIHVPTVDGKFKLSQYSSSSKCSCLSQLCSDFKIDKERVTFEPEQVIVRPLDSFDLKPLFLKIDVEGSELEVLRGGKQTIDRWKPITLLEINTLEKFIEIKKFMSSYGYDCFVQEKSSINMCANFQAHKNNYLFINLESTNVPLDFLLTGDSQN